IKLQIAGVSGLAVDAHGDLALSTTAGDVFLRRPRAYQVVDGATREVAADYVLTARNQVRIHVGAYDRQENLIIDPVLSYATYLGGATNQTISGIAVDSTGFAYVTGFTASTDFPVTSGVLQNAPKNAKSTAFVTKLKQDGTGLVFSTLIGGTGASGDAAR